MTESAMRKRAHDLLVQHGILFYSYGVIDAMLILSAEVAQAERERCAKACDHWATQNHVYVNGAIQCAKDIRSNFLGNEAIEQLPPVSAGDVVSVPREPTAGMLQAAWNLTAPDSANEIPAPAFASAMTKAYKAMLVASQLPAPPVGGKDKLG